MHHFLFNAKKLLFLIITNNYFITCLSRYFKSYPIIWKNDKKISPILVEFTILDMYESVTSASKQVGVNAKSIRMCAEGKQIHAGGFRWKNKD